jgi:hypothetical protein
MGAERLQPAPAKALRANRINLHEKDDHPNQIINLKRSLHVIRPRRHNWPPGRHWGPREHVLPPVLVGSIGHLFAPAPGSEARTRTYLGIRCLAARMASWRRGFDAFTWRRLTPGL